MQFKSEKRWYDLLVGGKETVPPKGMNPARNAWIKEDLNMYNTTSYMSTMLAEDVCAPELRNPNHSAIRARGWLARLFRRTK